LVFGLFFKKEMVVLDNVLYFWYLIIYIYIYVINSANEVLGSAQIILVGILGYIIILSAW
jgi:hypothetical protein